MKTHRPLLGVTLFYMIGILLGKYGLISWKLSIVLTVLFFLGSLIFLKNRFSFVLIFLSFMALGSAMIIRTQMVPADDIASVARFYRHQTIQIKGLVSSNIQAVNFFNRKKLTFQLAVEAVQTPWGWKRKSGTVLVNLFREEKVSYGDRILIEGKLHKPFNFSDGGHFSYQDYLENQGIFRILSVGKEATITILEHNQGCDFYQWLFQVHKKLNNLLEVYFSPNEAALMKGFLLGNRSFMQSNSSHELHIIMPGT